MLRSLTMLGAMYAMIPHPTNVAYWITLIYPKDCQFHYNSTE
jgi:hypothetical protein